ncbi:hypothetical protein V6N13_078585 [Hibiscus sabdariffa]|uniref:Agenet domain-containing protein n=1 Tax=Hibiscus sabdariffa TaxID=183260 RepID=A0ABR2RPP9_9ROSI
MDPHNLPFEVGQLVETRSFLHGFRGAWFRCKIKEISWKNKELGHSLEYVDFPDEKIRWTKLYQCGKSKDKKRTLMVRPCFPSVYREHQMPNVNIISETIVLVNDFWKVGDLVDWWTDNCFWTGRITEKLDDENVKVELLPPPEGEGSLYDASCKDLRPSLDWSVDEGWKLPKGDTNGLFCARIVKPLNQVSSLHIQDTPKQMLGMTDKLDDNGLKKRKIDESVCLNSTYSDTIEAAILDLEELIFRRTPFIIFTKMSACAKEIGECNSNSYLKGQLGLLSQFFFGT